MRVPKEFDEFCSHFLCWQAIRDCYGGSVNDMVEDIVASMNQRQRLTIKKVLDELLSGRYSSADLVGIWRRTPAKINLGNAKQTVATLTFIRDLLADPGRAERQPRVAMFARRVRDAK